jgi:hypothetical protein
MSTRIKIQSSEGVKEVFVTRLRKWGNEVLHRKGTIKSPPYLQITIWKKIEELQSFYQREKEELGVVTGEDTEFLATHEAWRGYPRIHICEERVKDVPDSVLQGVLHHEISHALLHGTPEFYTFRYSNKLQEAGQSCGLDLGLLQQCVYLMSIAIKDHDVVTWLSGIGLAQGQLALIEHMIGDTDEESRIWPMICYHPAQRKLALAVFLKTLIPIEAMISVRIKNAVVVKNQWKEAYRWLPEGIQKGLIRFARNIMADTITPFQERLEQATFRLIANSSL